MANNDRLKQTISNLQILTDLANSMIDSEIYPVSFFSQAFDLIQKIQKDIHKLEADQVDLFATQMKKHQALIMSIHQQMRNISSDVQEPVRKATTKPETTITEQSQKTSFLSRFGIKPTAENKNVTPPEVKTKPVIIEDPIEKTLVKPASEPDVKDKPTAKTVIPPVPTKSPVVRETSTKPAVNTTVAKHSAEQTKDTTSGNETVKTANDNFATKEANGSKSLNDAIEKKNLSDLRKAFSLNDRFRYRKELFNGNEEIMNKVITILNNKTSYKDSVTFVEEKLRWDFSNPTVKEFMKVLELRFL